MKKSSTCLVDDFCCIPCGVRRRARRLAFGDFNLMHPVRGVTGYVLSCLWADVISINAPRAGCDKALTYAKTFAVAFQSMHPVRGVTMHRSNRVLPLPISINAPRAGCDSKTIQSKHIFAARRMYNFANYVLQTLKHSLTYCIGITL